MTPRFYYRRSYLYTTLFVLGARRLRRLRRRSIAIFSLPSRARGSLSPKKRHWPGSRNTCPSQTRHGSCQCCRRLVEDRHTIDIAAAVIQLASLDVDLASINEDLTAAHPDAADQNYVPRRLGRRRGGRARPSLRAGSDSTRQRAHGGQGRVRGGERQDRVAMKAVNERYADGKAEL